MSRCILIGPLPLEYPPQVANAAQFGVAAVLIYLELPDKLDTELYGHVSLSPWCLLPCRACVRLFIYYLF